MLVDGADDHGDHGQKAEVLVWGVAWVEEVFPLVVGNGPVAVLAATVDRLEWFFVQKAHKTVLDRKSVV